MDSRTVEEANRDLREEAAQRGHAERALRAIDAGTSGSAGREFFRSLTHHLATALNAKTALIGEIINGPDRSVQSLSMWHDGEHHEHVTYKLCRTPCEAVARGQTLFHDRDVQNLYPDDALLRAINAESYIGTPLLDTAGRPVGVLTVLDDRPMADGRQPELILRIFASRAAAELERVRAETALRQSEQRFRALVEGIDAVVWEFEAYSERFTYVSPLAESLLGYTERQWLEPGFWYAHLHPEDQEWAQEFSRQHTREGRGYRMEYRMIAADGRVVWIKDITSVVEKTDESLGLRGVMIDVTQRKVAESSCNRFRAIMDQAGESIFVVDPESGRIMDANATACRALGYARAELLELSAWDIEASPVVESGDRWCAHVSTATQSDQPLMIEGVHRRKDGSEFPVEVGVSYREFEDRAYLLVTARDVTERHMIHEALRSEHESLHALIQAIPDIVYFKDLGRRNMLVNKAYEEYAGHSATQIIGKLDEELFPRSMAEKCRATDEQVLRTGHASHVERVLPDDRGQETVFDTIKTPIRGADGRIVGLVGISRDITQRKLEERRLRDAERQYRTLVEQLPVGVVVVDAETTLPIEFNNQAVAMLGCTRQEFARLRVADYEAKENPQEVKAHVGRILEQGHDDFVTKMRAKDGTIKDIRVSVRVMELDGRRVFHNVFSEIVRGDTDEVQSAASMIEPNPAVGIGEHGQEARPTETTTAQVKTDPG